MDTIKFWTSSEDSKKINIEGIKRFGVDKFFGAIDKLGYGKVKDFMLLKSNPYGGDQWKKIRSLEKSENSILTKPQTSYKSNGITNHTKRWWR